MYNKTKSSAGLRYNIARDDSRALVMNGCHKQRPLNRLTPTGNDPAIDILSLSGQFKCAWKEFILQIL